MIEDSIAAAMTALAEKRHVAAMNHLLDAQRILWQAPHSWRGDRDSPDALWYRMVPCKKPA